MATKSAKKLGPKDNGTTPIAEDCKGQVLSGDLEQLHSTAKEAVNAGDNKKAAHFYTLAIDKLAKNMKKDKYGRAADVDLTALNKSSEGRLAELLCGRSHVYLRQGDVPAAVEDAETCTRADPSFEKGHLRLAVAYETMGTGLARQLEACENGLESCPHSEVLVKRKWRLKKAIAEAAVRSQDQPDREPSTLEDRGAEPWGIEQTRKLADDASDPRHGMAAADLGRALAAGAYGLSKDLEAAARYLRIASDGGDIGAQRDLGLVLLDLEQPVEATEHLKSASEAGDEEASSVLNQLLKEASEREREAKAQLQRLAEMGDPRALTMLAEFGA